MIESPPDVAREPIERAPVHPLHSVTPTIAGNYAIIPALHRVACPASGPRSRRALARSDLLRLRVIGMLP